MYGWIFHRTTTPMKPCWRYARRLRLRWGSTDSDAEQLLPDAQVVRIFDAKPGQMKGSGRRTGDFSTHDLRSSTPIRSPPIVLPQSSNAENPSILRLAASFIQRRRRIAGCEYCRVSQIRSHEIAFLATGCRGQLYKYCMRQSVHPGAICSQPHR